VRVPDCTSAPYGGSVPSGGGGGGGGGGGCCPSDGSEYVFEYDFVAFGQQYVGVIDSLFWSSGSLNLGGLILNPPCDIGPPPEYLAYFGTLDCVGGTYYFSIQFACGPNFCFIDPSDFDYSVTGCPGNPTIYLTILPGRCASGSFVLRPA